VKETRPPAPSWWPFFATASLYGNLQPCSNRSTAPYTVHGTFTAVRTVTSPYRACRTVHRNPATKLFTEDMLHFTQSPLAGSLVSGAIGVVRPPHRSKDRCGLVRRQLTKLAFGGRN
jgi:hypothetical protein